jgi:putative nucleotidyltransferase with HDIG domain
MEGRGVLAERLRSERLAIADTVRTRLAARGLISASPLLARSLVATLAKSIEQSSPEHVVSWARMANDTSSPISAHDLIAEATEVTAEIAETLDLDFSAMLVFLEIVKAAAGEKLPPPPGARPEDTNRLTNSVIDGVLTMLKAHDEATCAHSHATGAWCRRLAGAMNLGSAQTDFIVKAGVLHDIGKIGTPDAILFKTGPLTSEEWVVMQRHAEFGAQILSELPALAQYAPIVRAHHERWDGKGYPNNLKGDQIPFEARVVAVADAFHAMISNRPYRPAIAQREAMQILREGRGTQWDTTVVDSMLKMLEAPRTSGTRHAAQG